jgi:hypothetical protein
MGEPEADRKAAKPAEASTGTQAPADRGEPVSAMEPLRIPETSRHRAGLADLALELAAAAAGFRRSLPEGVLAALADLVRAMNCYYSNLIEGHDTHSVDIERALHDDYSADAGKRNLQLEARAHIAVQQWIDAGGLAGRSLIVEGIREIHWRFSELLPEALLWTEDPDSSERLHVLPGGAAGARRAGRPPPRRQPGRGAPLSAALRERL